MTACRAALLLSLLAGGCGGQDVRPHLQEPFPERLSDWRLFRGRPSELRPNQGVVPYDVGVPLFSEDRKSTRLNSSH